MLPRNIYKNELLSVFNNPRQICLNKPGVLLPEMNLHYKGNLFSLLKIPVGTPFEDFPLQEEGSSITVSVQKRA